MKYRPLQPGLLVEGNSDEPYLRSLIKRQLDELILAKSEQTVEVLDCQVSDVRTTAEETKLVSAAIELARDCDVLFVHGDADACDRTAKLVDVLRERCAKAVRAASAVPLIPVLMTESWMLADRSALASVMGAEAVKKYPYPKPSAVEGRIGFAGGKEKLTPKQVWKTLFGAEGLDLAELLVRRTDLGALGQLPSYCHWRGETEEALKELRYL